ncbi:hypothetical protein [Peribacillus frigoritolerans]|uniref:hypothetical protein n=1 Tax=Peribacillus frigoritolerans TaxID=450367 RepID=UPI001F4FF9DB|nr:hypothetical protein [Peribacillus frigoritolerans]MCK2021258.1 hypothetical protein [Peribacillus frigoritolerans]
MLSWLKQQIWWVGIIFTFLIALFPETFSTIGTTIKFTFINYWLQISLLLIIILLLIVYRLLLKQQKSDSSG